MTRIEDCLNRAAARLRQAGIANSRHEARLLLAHATGLDFATIIGYPEIRVTDPSAFENLVARRGLREPLSHLTGRREFWSLEFAVTADTLDPRPDSEAVVEAALAHITDRSRSCRIADLGTGTGCLIAALLSALPNASGTAVERDPAAAAVAARNLKALGLGDRAQVVVGDWAAALAARFDLVVANPPYIASGEIDNLQPEVANFEPRRALDGGRDGLDALRRVLRQIPDILTRSGAAVVEFGCGQDSAVADLAREAGLAVLGFQKDLAGRNRCILCELSSS